MRKGKRARISSDAALQQARKARRDDILARYRAAYWDVYGTNPSIKECKNHIIYIGGHPVTLDQIDKRTYRLIAEFHVLQARANIEHPESLDELESS